MPYTVKAVTTWADDSLPVEQSQANVTALYQTDYIEPGYDLTPVHNLRRQVTNSGDLLARGSVISSDGLSIQTTTVWKSQAAYTAYSNDPVMLDYKNKMREAGWNIVFTVM